MSSAWILKGNCEPFRLSSHSTGRSELGAGLVFMAKNHTEANTVLRATVWATDEADTQSRLILELPGQGALTQRAWYRNKPTVTLALSHQELTWDSLDALLTGDASVFSPGGSPAHQQAFCPAQCPAHMSLCHHTPRAARSREPGVTMVPVMLPAPPGSHANPQATDLSGSQTSPK